MGFNVAEMIWPHIILVLFNLLNAWHDARRIKKHKKIYHAANLLVYGLAVFGSGLIYGGGIGQWILLCASALFNRFAVFNPILSVLRGLKWYYVSPERKAVADKFLYWLFGHNGKAPVIISGTLWLLTIAAQYIIHLLQFSK